MGITFCLAFRYQRTIVGQLIEEDFYRESASLPDSEQRPASDAWRDPRLRGLICEHLKSPHSAKLCRAEELAVWSFSHLAVTANLQEKSQACLPIAR